MSTSLGSCVETAENCCKTQLNSTLMPVIVSCLFAYFITSAFMAALSCPLTLCCFVTSLIRKLTRAAHMQCPANSRSLSMITWRLTTRWTCALGTRSSSRKLSLKRACSLWSRLGHIGYCRPGLRTKVQQDLDLVLCYDKDAQLLDYIGFYPATDPKTGASGLLAKSKAGGKLFKFNPNSPISNLTTDQIFSTMMIAGKNENNAAGINEAIKIRLSELPMNVHTIAVCAFIFKGGMMNQVKDLYCRCTEDICNPERTGSQQRCPVQYGFQDERRRQAN